MKMNVFKIYGVFLFLIQNIIFIHMFPVLESHLKMLYNNSKDAERVNIPIKKIEVSVIKSPRQDEDGGDEGNLVSTIAQTLTGVANNVFTDNFKFGNALAESAQILPGDAGETVSGFLNSVAEPINAVVGNPFQQFQEYLDQNFPITTSTRKPKPKAPTTKPPTIPTTRAPTVSHVFFVHKPPTSVPPLIPIKPSLPNKSGASTISLAASISSLPINEQGGGAYKRPIYSSPIVEESQAPVSNKPVVTTSSSNAQLANIQANSNNPASSNQPSLSKTASGVPLNSNVQTISNTPQLSNIPTESKKPIFSSKPLSSIPAATSNNLMNSNMPIFANSKPVSSNQLIVSNSPTFSNNPIGSKPNSPTFTTNPNNSNSPSFSKNPIGSHFPSFSNNPIRSNSPTFSNPTVSNSPGNSNNPAFSNSPVGISNTASISNVTTFSNKQVSPNKESTDSAPKTKFSQLLLNSNQPTTKSPLSGNNAQSFSELLLAGNKPSSLSNTLLREQQRPSQTNEVTFTNNAANLNQQIPNQLNTKNAPNLNPQFSNQLTNSNETANLNRQSSNELPNSNEATNLKQQILNANNQVDFLFNGVSHESDRYEPLNNNNVGVSQSLNAISAAMTGNANTLSPSGNVAPVANNVAPAPPQISVHLPNNNGASANFPPGFVPNNLPPNYNGSSIQRPNHLGNPQGLYPIPLPPPGEDDDDDEDGEDEDGNNRVA